MTSGIEHVFTLPANASPELMRLMNWRCIAILAADGRLGVGSVAMQLVLDMRPPTRDELLEKIAEVSEILKALKSQ